MHPMGSRVQLGFWSMDWSMDNAGIHDLFTAAELMDFRSLSIVIDKYNSQYWSHSRRWWMPIEIPRSIAIKRRLIITHSECIININKLYVKSKYCNRDIQGVECWLSPDRAVCVVSSFYWYSDLCPPYKLYNIRYVNCSLIFYYSCLLQTVPTLIKHTPIRALYHITIYQLYWYFGYTIHIVSFILVTR